MSDYVRTMVELRLRDLPLFTPSGKPRKLPDDCIEYLMSVVEWACTKTMEEQL